MPFCANGAGAAPSCVIEVGAVRLCAAGACAASFGVSGSGVILHQCEAFASKLMYLSVSLGQVL